MDKFAGLDGHTSSCTLGVMNPKGKHLSCLVIETNGEALVNVITGIPGKVHLCIEEGSQSCWLAEILSPHVEELVVVGLGQRRSKGQKNDQRDAFARGRHAAQQRPGERRLQAGRPVLDPAPARQGPCADRAGRRGGYRRRQDKGCYQQRAEPEEGPQQPDDSLGTRVKQRGFPAGVQVINQKNGGQIVTRSAERGRGRYLVRFSAYSVVGPF